MRRDPVGFQEQLERPLRRASRSLAIGLLALIVALMAYGIVASLFGDAPVIDAAAQDLQVDADGGDLALYQRISDRVSAGESYYVAAMDEQRAADYPTRPFVTVRLPTLTIAQRYMGESVLGMALFAALPLVIIVFMARIEKQVHNPERVGAGIAMLLGGGALIVPEAVLIHEVFAGLCLSFALALYRADRWWPSLIFAALALAIRELAAPFVLLWLAFAVAQRNWREAAAVTALLAMFAIGLYLHYLGVEAQRLAGDAPSQGWDALAGPILPMRALSELTALLFLPHWLATPLAIMPLLGWLGLGGRLGLFAGLWFAGFLTAMALFARPENFYWAQMTLPLYLGGLAFAPRAVCDLLAAATGKTAAQS